MENKLIAFCPVEAGKYQSYKGEEITMKDFLSTDYPAEINSAFNKYFNTHSSSPAFLINGKHMHVLVFSDGTFIRLTELEGKRIVKHQDKDYAEKLTKILKIK